MSRMIKKFTLQYKILVLGKKKLQVNEKLKEVFQVNCEFLINGVLSDYVDKHLSDRGN